MTPTQQAIEAAIRGGYERTEVLVDERDFYVFFDTDFWKSLSKDKGWKKIQWYGPYEGFRPTARTDRWHYEMHRFMDHMISGRTPDDFFAGIIKQ